VPVDHHIESSWGVRLNIFLSIFTNTILPTLFIAGVGFGLARTVRPDRRSISQLILNAFAPCLVFQSLTTANVPLADFGRIALFTLIVVGISAGLARAVSLIFHYNHLLTNTFLLMVMFTNVGNYGLPVITLAFGEQALTYGTIYFVVNNLLLYTLGTLIASSGNEPPLKALSRVARMPVVYAVALAGIVKLFSFQVPQPLFTALDMLSRATIPAMLVVLGMQLSSAGLKITRAVGVGTFIRLVAAPALAFLAARWMGLAGPALQAGMLEAAMPSGVVASVFAVEYDIEPEFAANMVLLTTLLSPFTITPLILLLR
jgi:malate permease and related proteins